MNLDALHERISEWFEPHQSCDRIGGCLKINCNDPNTGCKCDSRNVPDYTHDEAANARLLDVLIAAAKAQNQGSNRFPDIPESPDDPYGLLAYLFRHLLFGDNDRKAAVCDAFCKFAGIEVESE